MELEDSLEAFRPVGKVLEELGVSYQVGGSIASSLYGMPRGTNDVDVEANLSEADVEPFVARLEEQFVIEARIVRDAIAKIDIFLPKDRAFDRTAASRRRKDILLEDGSLFPFYVDSPEDTILRKLEWYRMGGEVSDQKWLDVLAVLKAQLFDLDFEYLQHWAGELRVGDLLSRALDEAGIAEEKLG